MAAEEDSDSHRPLYLIAHPLIWLHVRRFLQSPEQTCNSQISILFSQFELSYFLIGYLLVNIYFL